MVFSSHQVALRAEIITIRLRKISSKSYPPKGTFHSTNQELFPLANLFGYFFFHSEIQIQAQFRSIELSKQY